MLCPFCGKERRNQSVCPNCHEVQSTKVRGLTEAGFMDTLLEKMEDDILFSGEAIVQQEVAAEIAVPQSPKHGFLQLIAKRWERMMTGTFRQVK